MVLSQIPVLSRVGHDRAADRRTDQAWLAAAWERGLALVVTPEYTTAVVDQAAGAALALRPCSSVPAESERYFLGLAGGDPVFAVRGPRDQVVELPTGSALLRGADGWELVGDPVVHGDLP